MAVRNFNCLYSNQKTKKRKSWSDGILKVLLNESRCDLFAVQDNQLSLNQVIASHIVTKSEMSRIVQGVVTEIEFENYLVTIDFIKEDNTPLCSAKPKKFKVPATVIPIKKPVDQPIDIKSVQKYSTSSATQFSKNYSITDDELDSIWGMRSTNSTLSRSEDVFDNIKNEISNSDEASYSTNINCRSALSSLSADNRSNNNILNERDGPNMTDPMPSRMNQYDKYNTIDCNAFSKDETDNAVHLDRFIARNIPQNESSSTRGNNNTKNNRNNTSPEEEEDIWGAAPVLLANTEYDDDNYF